MNTKLSREFFINGGRKALLNEAVEALANPNNLDAFRALDSAVREYADAACEWSLEGIDLLDLVRNVIAIHVNTVAGEDDSTESDPARQLAKIGMTANRVDRIALKLIQAVATIKQSAEEA